MTLAELIASDAENATRTDAEVLTWLNTLITAFVDVDWLELTVWLHTSGITRTALAAAASSGGTAATQTAAQHILDCVTAGQPLSASDERVRNLVQASSLAGAAKSALTALATRQKARWDAAGIGEVTLGQIEALRWVN